MICYVRMKAFMLVSVRSKYFGSSCCDSQPMRAFCNQDGRGRYRDLHLFTCTCQLQLLTVQLDRLGTLMVWYGRVRSDQITQPICISAHTQSA
jgi:hypothetical protein